MTTVAVVVHPSRELAKEVAEQLIGLLASQNAEVITAAVDPQSGAIGVQDIEKADLVVSVGGDGTMLQAMGLALRADLPVIGVNAGQLAYLTEIEPAQLPEATKRLVNHEYQLDRRTALQATVESDALRYDLLAVNEVVIEREHSGRVARFGISINDSFFTTYAADGVIMATPTGSTAYSFSARGPIVSPREDCMVLTPVSPHMLFDRALVLHSSEHVTVEVLDPVTVKISADGRSFGNASPGTRVDVRVSDRTVKLCHLYDRNFHQVLKAKFRLADR